MTPLPKQRQTGNGRPPRNRNARRPRRVTASVRGLQGAARYGLLNMPEPVAAADADFNRGVTLKEFRQAAIDRFQLLDTSTTAGLRLPELEAHAAGRPADGRVKRPKRRARHAVGIPSAYRD